MTEKGRQYWLAVLEKRQAKLVARSSSEVDDLMYSYQNCITAKEDLEQLNNMFTMVVEIHHEQEEIDEQYDDEIWLDDMDQKIFSFKKKVHN